MLMIKKEQRRDIFDVIKKAYLAYFGVKIGDQDKAWAPHIVCKICTEHLRQWNKGKRRSLKFGVSMIWREPTNHFDDCYFCLTKITGIKKITAVIGLILTYLQLGDLFLTQKKFLFHCSISWQRSMRMKMMIAINLSIVITFDHH